MLRPWPEAKLTPIVQPVALLMDLGPWRTPSGSGQEASEVPHTLSFMGSLTLRAI